MPEKVADKIEVNGVALPTPEKVMESTRRYVWEAEKAGEDTFRTYNELIATTFDFYFDTLEKTIHDSVEITTRAERAIDDILAIYRRGYTEGFKSWQTYWQDANKVFAPPK